MLLARGDIPGATACADESLALARTQGDLWIFGFGSLLWKPAFDFVEERMATVRWLHRSFFICFFRWRCTRDRPGLMMVLYRVGTFRVKFFRVPAAEA